MAIVAVHRAWKRVRDRVFSTAARSSFAAYGPHSVISLPARIDGAQHIEIGANVYVGSSSWLHSFAPEGGQPGRIVIGDDVKITGRVTFSAAHSIEVGRGVLIAAGVYVADHGHRFGNSCVPIHHQGTTTPSPVVIGRNAWIGQNAVILAGVEIGAGAVVGSNAVVTKDVPAGAVAVGVPAAVREPSHRAS